MKTLKIILFYIFSYTWGILMSLIGLLAFVGLLITGHKPKRFHHILYFEIGKGWGGVNLGPVFLCCEGSNLATKQHECGHGIQNVWFGPLQPFIVGIPSAYRYWLRTFETESARINFAAIIEFIGLLLGASSLTLGIIFGIVWLMVLAGVIIIYVSILTVWGVAFEIPKYNTFPWPSYYSVWFEGGATNLGEKYFKET